MVVCFAFVMGCGGGKKKSGDKTDRNISSTDPNQPTTPTGPTDPKPTDPAIPPIPGVCQPSNLFDVNLEGRSPSERILSVYDVVGQDGQAEVVTNMGVYQKTAQGVYQRIINLNLGEVRHLVIHNSKPKNGIYKKGSYAWAYKDNAYSLWVRPGRFVKSTGNVMDLFVVRQSDRGVGEMMVYSYDERNKLYAKAWPRQGTASITGYFPTRVRPIGAGQLFKSDQSLWGVLFGYTNEDYYTKLSSGPVSYWSKGQQYQVQKHSSNIMYLQFYQDGGIRTGEATSTLGLGYRRDVDWAMGHFAKLPPPQDDRVSVAALSRCHKEWPNTDEEMASVGDSQIAIDHGCPKGGYVLWSKNEGGQAAGGSPELYLTKIKPSPVVSFNRIESKWPGYYGRMLSGRIDSDKYDDLLVIHPNGTSKGALDAALCVLKNKEGEGFEDSCYINATIPTKDPKDRYFTADLDSDNRTELVVEKYNPSGSPDIKAMNFNNCN